MVLLLVLSLAATVRYSSLATIRSGCCYLILTTQHDSWHLNVPLLLPSAGLPLQSVPVSVRLTTVSRSPLERSEEIWETRLQVSFHLSSKPFVVCVCGCAYSAHEVGCGILPDEITSFW